MTRIAPATTPRRTLEYVEWFARANEALHRTSEGPSSERSAGERAFRALHADTRYRARLYL